MNLFLNILCKTIKFLWKIIKLILLLPLYCSMPDKYRGVTYDEWLKKDDNAIDAEYS